MNTDEFEDKLMALKASGKIKNYVLVIEDDDGCEFLAATNPKHLAYTIGVLNYKFNNLMGAFENEDSNSTTNGN